jgi:hypothetical protein
VLGFVATISGHSLGASTVHGTNHLIAADIDMTTADAVVWNTTASCVSS